MFTQKKTTLFKGEKTKAITQPFISAGTKQSALTKSGNYAIKYSTTGNDFVDQFSMLGVCKQPRNFADIHTDCVKLYAQDPTMAVKFILFLRTISRIVQLPDGSKTSKVQKGGGLKHEAIMRMIWLAVNHSDVFWTNLPLFIAVGSWRDVFQMLTYDLEYNGWDDKVLDWDKFGDLFKYASTNETQVDLFKKYMPHIRAKSKCKTLRAQARTVIAKWLANTLGVDYKQYRLLKRSGSAHTWQQVISKKDFANIDFNSIHGRALMQLVNSKFIDNQGLTKDYEEWIMAQPIAKFTGYVHELAMKFGKGGSGYWSRTRSTSNLKPYQKHTINKQYDGLVELARKDVNVQSGLIVVRDTSGSMSSDAIGVDMAAGDVAKALGIFFGDMLDGHFKNAWIDFAREARIKVYKTNTFTDKWEEDSASGYVGNTDFQSVIRLFCTIKRQGVSEADFPTGILCISDGEFDPGDLGSTNVATARRKLRNEGFSQEYVDNFQIVLWNIPNGYYGEPEPKFETFGDAENVFYLSGYDGSILSFLLGGSDRKSTPKTAEELFLAAMDQEVLNMIKI